MKLHQKLFWLLVFLLPVQLARHFWPETSFVLGLRVDYLSPTVYLTDLLFLLILITWAWTAPFRKNFRFGFIFLALTTSIFLLTNSWLALNSTAAFYKFAKIIEFGFLITYIAFSKLRLKDIQLPLSLAIIYSSLIALGQFFKQASLNGFFWFLGERTFDIGTPGIARAIFDGHLLLRPYATFPHPNALAGFLLVSLVLIAIPFNFNKGYLKFWRILALVVGLVVITLSFSRTVWLASFLLLFVLTFLLKPKKIKIPLLLLELALAILIFLMATSFSTDEAFYQRLQLVKGATLMFQQFSLSGVGLNNFIVSLPKLWAVTGFTYLLQPVHNIYLLLLAETGLVGLIIFIWFLFLSFQKIFRDYNLILIEKAKSEIKLKNIKEILILMIALGLILLIGVFDHYWLTLQQNLLLFCLVLGLIWSSKN